MQQSQVEGPRKISWVVKRKENSLVKHQRETHGFRVISLHKAAEQQKGATSPFCFLGFWLSRFAPSADPPSFLSHFFFFSSPPGKKLCYLDKMKFMRGNPRLSLMLRTAVGAVPRCRANEKHETIEHASLWSLSTKHKQCWIAGAF